MGQLKIPEQHRFDEAISAFEHGLKLQPKHVPLLVDRGDVAAAQGMWGDAARYYREATKHAPDSSPLLIKLGMANYLSQQWSGAKAAYLKAVQLDPKAADAYNTLAVPEGVAPVRVVNNVFVGIGALVNWTVEMQTNLSVNDAGLVDRIGFDYRSRKDSPAINAAVAQGASMG